MLHASAGIQADIISLKMFITLNENLDNKLGFEIKMTQHNFIFQNLR
jgi:hypothetical protein